MVNEGRVYRSVIVWGLTSLCWLLPFVFVPGSLLWDFENLPKISVLFAGVSVLLVVWLVGVARGELARPVWNPMLVIGLVAFFLLTVGFLRAGSLSGALPRWMLWTACLIAGFLAVQTFTRTEYWERLLVGVFVGGLVMSGIIALQYFGEWQGIRQLAAPSGTFNHRNMAAQFYVFVIPAAVGFLWAQQRLVWVWLTAGGLAMLLAIPIYTSTRAVLLALVCQLVVILLACRISHANKLSRLFSLNKSAALIFAVCLGVLAGQLTPQGWRWQESTITAQSPDGVTNNSKPIKIGIGPIRQCLYHNALLMAWENPVLGIGLDQFRYHYAGSTLRGKSDPHLDLFTSPNYAHNDYLQWAAELGLLAPFLALLFFWFQGRVSCRALRDCTDHAKQRVLLVAAAVVAGVAVNACFSFPLYRAVPPFLLALLAAVPWALDQQPGSMLQARRSKLVARVVTAVVGVLCVGLCWQSVRLLRADHLYYQQRTAFDAKDYPRVIQLGEMTLALQPDHVLANGHMGVSNFVLGKYQVAENYCRKVQQMAPWIASNGFCLALTLNALGELDEAEEICHQWLKILPDEPGLQQLATQIHARKALIEQQPDSE